MKSLLFPPDTRAPMPVVWHDGKWARTWARTEDGILVKDGMISDWEAYVWGVGMKAVEEESDG